MFISKWAKIMLKGTQGFKELDKGIEVRIDQRNKGLVTSDMRSLSAGVIKEEDYTEKIKNVEDLPDIPLYDIVYKTLDKSVIEKIDNYLEENKLSFEKWLNKNKKKTLDRFDEYFEDVLPNFEDSGNADEYSQKARVKGYPVEYDAADGMIDDFKKEFDYKKSKRDYYVRYYLRKVLGITI